MAEYVFLWICLGLACVVALFEFVKGEVLRAIGAVLFAILFGLVLFALYMSQVEAGG